MERGVKHFKKSDDVFYERPPKKFHSFFFFQYNILICFTLILQQWPHPQQQPQLQWAPTLQLQANSISGIVYTFVAAELYQNP